MTISASLSVFTTQTPHSLINRVFEYENYIFVKADTSKWALTQLYMIKVMMFFSYLLSSLHIKKMYSDSKLYSHFYPKICDGSFFLSSPLIFLLLLLYHHHPCHHHLCSCCLITYYKSGNTHTYAQILFISHNKACFFFFLIFSILMMKRLGYIFLSGGSFFFPPTYFHFNVP